MALARIQGLMIDPRISGAAFSLRLHANQQTESTSFIAASFQHRDGSRGFERPENLPLGR